MTGLEHPRFLITGKIKTCLFVPPVRWETNLPQFAVAPLLPDLATN